MMAHLSNITFEEVCDPFPDEDIFDTDYSCLDEKYMELSKQLFGDAGTVQMTILIDEFKEAAKKERIEIPGCVYVSQGIYWVYLALSMVGKFFHLQE